MKVINISKKVIIGYIIFVLFIFFNLDPKPVWGQSWQFKSLPEPDSYPRTVENNDLGENISNGQPMKIRRFTTRDSIDMVINYFQNQWKIEGGTVVEDDLGGGMRVISTFLGPDRKTMKSIILHKDPDSKLTVVFSSSSFVDFNQVGGQHNPEFPIYPGSEVLYSYETFDGGLSQLIVHHNRATVSQNASYYYSQMRSRGWELTGETGQKSKDDSSALFKKGSKSCMINITKNPGMSGTFVMIQLLGK